MIGFGWLGHAHSRSLLRIPTLFADRSYDPELVACSDPLPARTRPGGRLVRVRARPADWRAVIDDPDVDAVFIAAPNMLHVELVEAVARRARRCSARSRSAARPSRSRGPRGPRATAGVISGVGYNYRWAPLVRYARELIAGGELGEITNYRGRFFSMYGPTRSASTPGASSSTRPATASPATC